MNGREISLQALFCFAVAAETENYTRTAEQLGFAQPSVSLHIKLLEERLGVELFEGKPRVKLTPAGAELAQYAKTITSALEKMVSHAQTLKTKNKEAV